MTAYEKICAEACGGCRDGDKFAVIIGKIGNPKVHEFDPDGMGAHYEPCKAPPRDEVIERLTAELAASNTKLREVGEQLEFDRSAVADGVTAIKKAVNDRHWLTEGRGCYDWSDDRWHEEFYAAAVEILASCEPLSKIAANWQHCPQTTEEVAKARIDLKADLAALKLERDELRADKERLRSAVDAAPHAAGCASICHYCEGPEADYHTLCCEGPCDCWKAPTV